MEKKRKNHYNASHVRVYETKRNNTNFTSVFCHRPEHNAKRKYFEQHRGTYRKMFLLPRHRHRRQRERSVIEFQLKRHVHGIH